MHTYIDESGTFTATFGRSSISVVGALIVPSALQTRLREAYGPVRRTLPKDDGEVKGRGLSEEHFERVIHAIRGLDVLFEVVMIDVGLHSENEIRAHKLGQEAAITANPTGNPHESIHRQLRDLRTRLERMPLQLYVQSVVTFELVRRVLDIGCTYYAQRRPRELARFHWIVDAKDRARTTDWEDWWSFVVLPSLQSKSTREPMPMLEGADYSHMERFVGDAPDWLVPFAEGRDLTEGVLDLKAMLTENFRFSPHQEVGLELVDILCSALRRALNGNLGERGWRDLHQLMVNRKGQCVGMISMGAAVPDQETMPYRRTLMTGFRRGGRVMLVG